MCEIYLVTVTLLMLLIQAITKILTYVFKFTFLNLIKWRLCEIEDYFEIPGKKHANQEQWLILHIPSFSLTFVWMSFEQLRDTKREKPTGKDNCMQLNNCQETTLQIIWVKI